MSKHILVTGGAGFIGSHIVDALVERGHQVRILDCLDPQVHGQDRKKPDYLNPNAEFIQGDVRNPDDLKKAFDGIEVLYHQAAAVGVGQSMYSITHYTEVNAVGAAAVLQMIPDGVAKLERMIVASSMSIYGEGKYHSEAAGTVYPKMRGEGQLARGEWEPLCPSSGKPLEKRPTDEEKPLNPTSVYAIGKRDHEEMFLAVGRAYDVPTVALRYFNVYGTRQALSNPYTGVAAIFSGRLLNGNPPVIYEDGGQTRDFVHVSDIVQANLLALEKSEADYEVFNVGTGRAVSVKEVADVLKDAICPEKDVTPEITGKFRQGDIRHCYADISKIREKLGYRPKVAFEDGMKALTEWVRAQEAEDNFEAARAELAKRGLTSE